MLKKSAGNMYPWVTHTKSYLRGQCPHHCSYCYVQAMAKKFKAVRDRYSGPVALDEEELTQSLGTGRTIFIEHQSDLFAAGIPGNTISRVLEHCCAWPDNTYVFQTKHPWRYFQFLEELPPTCLLGTTLETDRVYSGIMGNCPPPIQRADAMHGLAMDFPGTARFVTIEPILDFDPHAVVTWLRSIAPAFVNIGADSKGTNLPEPSAEKVWELIGALKAHGIEIRQKTNLSRLLGK